MTQMEKELKLFSGSVNPDLSTQIAKELGVELGNVRLEKFSNGEIYARYLESIRGDDVFLVQSVSDSVDGAFDVNDALMELLIMVDAAKRASARSITAVIPHYGYARQDRKAASREPITAKLVADLLSVAGIDRLISIDLHVGQIQGYFDIPVDHLTALPILVDYFWQKEIPQEKLCIVSPDVGRAKEAKRISDKMNADLAIMHKGRPGHNKAEITALIGDVEGKVCIVNDDMIDTAGSIVAATKTLQDRGAEKIFVCCTHPVFSGPAYERLENAPVEEVVCCNTIPVPAEKQTGKIKVVSVAPLLAKAIRSVYTNKSVSDLFDTKLQAYI